MFGELLGVWLGAIRWQQMGSPNRRRAARSSWGPGRGTLMARRAARHPADACRAFTAVDRRCISSRPTRNCCAQAQQTGAVRRVQSRCGMTRIETICRPARLLLVANEFFDALPIRPISCGRPRAPGMSACVGLNGDRLRLPHRRPDRRAAARGDACFRAGNDGDIARRRRLPPTTIVATLVGHGCLASFGGALLHHRRLRHGQRRDPGESACKRCSGHARQSILWTDPAQRRSHRPCGFHGQARPGRSAPSRR